ncbi:MAG: LysR family transcriptional regulator [Syntrophobacterales bacterium]|nr:LysR family transcriptional regulator [Syntrophobacterales bacterium]
MMNLNQLRALYCVVKTGTFARAAEELFVTEPAVYIQVRSLEKDMGFILLDRFGKELQPTEMGKLLYDYAEKIFGLVAEATQAVQELKDLKSGSLRLGVTKALSQYLMPSVIANFQDRHPHLSIHLDERSSRELVEGILLHRFELAIAAKVPYPKRVAVVPFTRDELILVGSPSSKLLKQDKVTLENLTAESIIFSDARSATKFTMWHEFEIRGLSPTSIIEAGSTEFIKSLVKKGKGYAFIASICVREDINNGTLAAIPLAEGSFNMDICIIHLKGKTLSPAAAAFVSFLQKDKGSRTLTKLVDGLVK